MTNIELIKELQKSVDKYGELPVEVLGNEIYTEDIGYDSECVTIYDSECVTIYDL